MLLGPALCSGQELFRFMAVKVFKCFQFFNKCLVLVLQDGHSVLQTLDILLFLPATFTSCLSVLHEADFPFAGDHLGSAPGGEGGG